MKKLWNSKNNNHGAINRLIVIMLVLIAIMAIIISIPLRKAFEYRSECIACEQAMKSAGDGLVIEYLYRQKEGSIEEARETIIEVMPAREHICPTNGNVYLIKNEDGVFEPVCGLHDPDIAQRTRLNASFALNRLTEIRADSMKKASGSSDSFAEPSYITIKVNGKPLKCMHVTKEEMIHRGTKTTNGYKGVVAFYGVAGDFTFSTRYADKGNGTAKDGEICYFVYADENYAAIWRSNNGWTGDSYEVE